MNEIVELGKPMQKPGWPSPIEAVKIQRVDNFKVFGNKWHTRKILVNKRSENQNYFI